MENDSEANLCQIKWYICDTGLATRTAAQIRYTREQNKNHQKFPQRTERKLKGLLVTSRKRRDIIYVLNDKWFQLSTKSGQSG